MVISLLVVICQASVTTDKPARACPAGQVFSRAEGACKTCRRGSAKVPDTPDAIRAACYPARQVCGTAEVAVEGSCKPCPAGQVPLNAEECGPCPEQLTKQPDGAVRDATCQELPVATASLPLSCDPLGPPLECGVGACRRTMAPCTPAGQPNTCVPFTPGPETCNGIDDNCDGEVDEGLGELECGIGGCRRVTPVCVDGQLQTCTPGEPSPEVCNSVDDDCDGSIDEPADLGVVSCGVGQCKSVLPACRLGTPSVCTPNEPRPETCNGLDDDCNGSVDDNIADLTCGVGQCRRTAPACQFGIPGICMPGQPQPEVCNGLDDDCDGTVDNGLGFIMCGVGECRQIAAACINGVPGMCIPRPPQPEICGDGLDNNCDGRVDEPECGTCVGSKCGPGRKAKGIGGECYCDEWCSLPQNNDCCHDYKEVCLTPGLLG